MSYTNFKPTIWSKQIQMDLEKLMVWRDICNTKFQGDAGKGKTVKIIGVTEPTIKKYVPGTNIAAPETPSDTSMELKIDQYDYFNILVDDVDQAQAHVDIMRYLLKGGATKLAETADTYISSLVKNAKTSVVGDFSTPAKAKATIDEAFVKLWEAGVKTSRDTFIVLSPATYSKFKNSMEENLTNNVQMLERGIFGYYNGATVKMSNNIFNDGTDDYLAVVKKDAITFANGIDETTAYKPEGQFADAVKCLHTYGAKVVRPEQVVAIKVANA